MFFFDGLFYIFCCWLLAKLMPSISETGWEAQAKAQAQPQRGVNVVNQLRKEGKNWL